MRRVTRNSWLLTWALLVFPLGVYGPAAEENARPGPLSISEFLAVNEGGLQDEDHDSSDWIEIHNSLPGELDLEGYALTDDPDELGKWIFPTVTIPGGGYLHVFASGKDRRDPKGRLHTNFQLAASGEYLALVAPDGRTVHSQWNPYPPQKANVSYGRDGYWHPPTPGARNEGPAYAGWVGDVEFSVPRGFHEKPFSLALSCPTPGVRLRYTVDGNPPTETTGLPYTTPIEIRSTTPVRACAFRDGYLPATVLTNTYLFARDVVRSPVMSRTITRGSTGEGGMVEALKALPSISIVSGSTPNGRREISGSVELLSPGDGEPGFHAPCGIKEFGGDYTHFEKRNFRLYFRSIYGASKLRYPLFEGHGRDLAPADAFDQLSLRSGSHDMRMRGFYMANRFTDDTMLDMGHVAPHGRFVHLYLNGIYWGQYHLRERWGADMLSQYLGGKKEHYEAINGNLNVGGWSVAGPRTVYDGSGMAWAKLKRLALNAGPANYDAIGRDLDVTQYVDYMLMYMYGNAECEFRAVGVSGPGSGFKFFLNDADGFLGNAFQSNRARTAFASYRPGVFGKHFADGPGSFFSLLWKSGHPDFRVLVADRIQMHFFNRGSMTDARNLARLNERLNQVEESMLTEIARWRDSGQTYRRHSDWAAVAELAKHSWLPGRSAWIVNQWRAAGFYPAVDSPRLSQHGGGVESDFALDLRGGGGGEIYYTTTGADPRLPGGELHPEAQRFEDGMTNEVPVPSGAIWRYHDRGLVVPPDWKEPAYNDRGWRRGLAELGYGDGDERTRVSHGGRASQKHVTCYFRHAFSLAKTDEIVSATVHLKRDDGAVVYLNGREAVRSNMSKGRVDRSTFAVKADDDGKAFHRFRIPVNLLRRGENLLAVEVHQSSRGSSDLSFDLSLSLEREDLTKRSASIRLTQNTHVRARTRRGKTWSALNEAFFVVGEAPAVGPGDVVVSELHYHPEKEKPKTEFVELMNISGRAINLCGTAFTKGIRYVFPSRRDVLLAPGEKILLVEDRYHFEQRYGLGLPVFGQYGGNLDNGGESLELRGADGSQVLLDLSYDDGGRWPKSADGAGPSLVLADPRGATSGARAWRASAEPGGSPGR